MYVGNKHSETQRKTIELSFACAHCKHRGLALVKAKGQGSGVSLLGLESDSAQTRASESAEAAVRKDGLRSLRLSKCPACLRRQPGALGGALFSIAIQGLLLFGAFAIAGFVIGEGKGMPTWLRGIQLAAIGGFALYELWRIANAGSRLEFVKKR